MGKYSRARPVVAVQAGLSTRSTAQPSRPVKLVLRKPRSNGAVNSPNAVPKRSELVFLQGSPTYCDKDPVAGSLGTMGRFCNRSSRGTYVFMEILRSKINFFDF